MTTETVLVVSILILCFAMVSGVITRYALAPALIFVLIGVALGPSGLKLVEIRADREGFLIIAELALTVILFDQASKLDVRTLFRRERLSLRLLGIGIPLTIMLGTLTAVALLPSLPFWEAVCLAVIVAPTEVALIDALLEDARIPERVRNALSVESGCYDGAALAVLLAAVALASEQADPAGGHWAWFAIRMEVVSLVAGVAIGVIGGYAAAWAHVRGWMTQTWAGLVTLALAFVSFAVGEALHGSGFVTAFAGGLAYAITAAKGRDREEMTQVSDAAAQVLELVVFGIFGAVAVVPAWREATWTTVLFAALTVFAVRIAAVGIATIGSGIPIRNTLFMGWFGPRGIGTLVLALIVLDEGELQQADMIVQVAVIVVTLSLVLHSVTAVWANEAVRSRGRTRSTEIKG